MSSFVRFYSSKRLIRLLLTCLALLLTACSSGGQTTNTGQTAAPAPPVTPSPTINAALTICPDQLKNHSTCQTPYTMRVAYGMEALLEQGMTGKGQTVVDIVSYGSPTLQQDMDVFDRQFGLPAITLQILSPIGAVKFDTNNSEMLGWAEETTLDVEIIHAMAPEAGIVVLTSPVDETEGTIGMPQFLQLEQYAVNHKLGQIFSQSYVASETTLADKQGQQLLQDYNTFYQQITTRDGWTVLSGSGDHGATDYSDIDATQFSTRPIVNFPADVPWVTAVGGTTLASALSPVNETAWSGSGGGISVDFPEPDYQKNMPASIQNILKGHRGIPDVAANADPGTSMAIYFDGTWQLIGGTSAATPTWAGMIAVADQMAGHGLGSINQGLYKIGTSSKATQDFRDIISGDNSFNAGEVTVKGYAAQKGWDLITGWGAPVGSKLLPDLIASLSS